MPAPFNAQHGRRKLSEADARAISALRKEGYRVMNAALEVRGVLRIGVKLGSRHALVRLGRELGDLVTRHVTLEEISRRRAGEKALSFSKR